eukprot:SAG22_NODE_55_length_23749_cov_24.622918_12_plen_319_part_00
MLPAVAGEGEVAAQNMPHAWLVTGCPESKYDGCYGVDPDDPVANQKPHYVNGDGLHMYFRGGWWVHKDIYTPDENSSISRIIADEDGNALPQGNVAWEWWTGDSGWQSVSLQVQLQMLEIDVSGCPEARYNGVYKLDPVAPTANGKPHYVNGEEMHLYYGSVNGWYFKDQYTPHESNATAYSLAVLGANTWQWWNKERAEWIAYACTIEARPYTPPPPAPEAAVTADAAAAAGPAAVVVSADSAPAAAAVAPVATAATAVLAVDTVPPPPAATVVPVDPAVQVVATTVVASAPAPAAAAVPAVAAAPPAAAAVAAAPS